MSVENKISKSCSNIDLENNDKIEEQPKKHSLMNMSTVTIGYVTFVGDSARGILFPALWPLCQQLGGNKVHLGFLVAIFSVGRLVISTRLGIMADQYGHRFALLLSGCILNIGTLLWANSPFLGGLPMLYLAQFTLGLGTGSLGVTRSYIVEQTPPEKRTFMMARLTSLQYAGFAATPLLGAALVVVGKSISSFWEYALPPYLILLFSLASMYMLYYYLKDLTREDRYETTRISIDVVKEKDSPIIPVQKTLSDETSEKSDAPTISSSMDSADINNSPSDSERKSLTISPLFVKESGTSGLEEPKSLSALPVPISNPDRNKVYILMLLLNLTTRGAIAVYETQGSQILLDDYNVSEILLGTFVTIAGTIGTIQLIFYKQFWTMNFSDMKLMLGGLTFTLAAQFIVINWTMGSICPVWLYLISMYMVYSFGYPISNSSVLGSFSLLQKQGKQSKEQGRFAFMGSLARVLLPIISGFLEEFVGTTSSFTINLIMMSLSIGGLLMYYNKVLRYTLGSAIHPSTDDSFGNMPFFRKVGLFGCILSILAAIGALIKFAFN